MENINRKEIATASERFPIISPFSEIFPFGTVYVRGMNLREIATLEEEIGFSEELTTIVQQASPAYVLDDDVLRAKKADSLSPDVQRQILMVRSDTDTLIGVTIFTQSNKILSQKNIQHAAIEYRAILPEFGKEGIDDFMIRTILKSVQPDILTTHCTQPKAVLAWQSVLHGEDYSIYPQVVAFGDEIRSRPIPSAVETLVTNEYGQHVGENTADGMTNGYGAKKTVYKDFWAQTKSVPERTRGNTLLLTCVKQERFAFPRETEKIEGHELLQVTPDILVYDLDDTVRDVFSSTNLTSQIEVIEIGHQIAKQLILMHDNKGALGFATGSSIGKIQEKIGKFIIAGLSIENRMDALASLYYYANGGLEKYHAASKDQEYGKEIFFSSEVIEKCRETFETTVRNAAIWGETIEQAALVLDMFENFILRKGLAGKIPDNFTKNIIDWRIPIQDPDNPHENESALQLYLKKAQDGRVIGLNFGVLPGGLNIHAANPDDLPEFAKIKVKIIEEMNRKMKGAVQVIGSGWGWLGVSLANIEAKRKAVLDIQRCVKEKNEKQGAATIEPLVAYYVGNENYKHGNDRETASVVTASFNVGKLPPLRMEETTFVHDLATDTEYGQKVTLRFGNEILKNGAKDITWNTKTKVALGEYLQEYLQNEKGRDASFAPNIGERTGNIADSVSDLFMDLGGVEGKLGRVWVYPQTIQLSLQYIQKRDEQTLECCASYFFTILRNQIAYSLQNDQQKPKTPEQYTAYQEKLDTLDMLITQMKKSKKKFEMKLSSLDTSAVETIRDMDPSDSLKF